MLRFEVTLTSWEDGVHGGVFDGALVDLLAAVFRVALGGVRDGIFGDFVTDPAGGCGQFVVRAIFWIVLTASHTRVQHCPSSFPLRGTAPLALFFTWRSSADAGNALSRRTGTRGPRIQFAVRAVLWIVLNANHYRVQHSLSSFSPRGASSTSLGHDIRSCLGSFSSTLSSGDHPRVARTGLPSCS